MAIAAFQFLMLVIVLIFAVVFGYGILSIAIEGSKRIAARGGSRWVTVLPAIMAMVGVLGFLWPAAISLGLTIGIDENTQLPLGDFKGIVVDAEGNVYCQSGAYNRIQVYKRDGHFISGWFMPTTHLSLALGAEGEIELASTHGKLYVMSPRGRLLRERTISLNEAIAISERGRTQTTDRAGSTYETRGGVIFPHVVRIDGGNETIIIDTPWYQWIWMGPLPAFFWFALGFIAIGSAASIDETRKPSDPGLNARVTG